MGKNQKSIKQQTTQMRNLFSLLTFFSVTILHAANDNFRYEIDLNKVVNDKLHVALSLPKLKEEKIIFGFPKMVPGTYSISDFGRFIENVKAFDLSGAVVNVTKLDANKWEMENTKGISKIEYEVNDTYDEKTANPIFEPGGTNIQQDTNYVLNLFGVLGYVNGYFEQPINLSVKHGENLFGSTSLVDKDASSVYDLFEIDNYHEAVDNPIMYAKPDTATVTVGNTEVLISVFSTAQPNRAKMIAQNLDTLLQAQGKYLGGTLPVNKYSFLIYMASGNGVSGGFGALEHSYSSFYYMPEMPDNILIPQLREIAAHEFFHIITPLNIHSEEIQYFDYDNPKMSDHLWLYEGTTEYHAHAMQVKYGFYSADAFLQTLKEKMTGAQFAFNDTLPFTEMSKGCLDTFENQYPNVYLKGALIGMCLDLLLLKESNGKRDLMDLINDLAKKYGKNTPFKDTELFDVITKLTYPSVGEFLKKYVAGTDRLPYAEMLQYAGVKYTPAERSKQFSMGQIDMGYNPETQRLIVAGTDNMNDFGRQMGYKVGDEISKVNGKRIAPVSFKAFRDNWMATVQEGDKLAVQVLRKGENGKAKKVKLSNKVFKSESNKYHLMSFDENASAEQIAIRKAWLEK